MIPGQAVERFSLDNLLVDKNGLYSIKIDWTDRVKITEFPVSWIFVTGEWIYFSGRQKLNDINSWAFDGVGGNWMYITEYTGQR